MQAIKKKYDKSESIISWLMISPQVIGFLVFILYPLLWVYRYAFYDYDGVREVFVGLDNFIRAFTRDTKYWMSLANTFIIAYGKLIIELPLSLGLAIAINKKFRGNTFFRIVFYMPCIISTAVVGLIFSFLFSSYNGPVNVMLQNLGIVNGNINWFGSKWTSMAVIMIASIWQCYGQNMMFILAGLQGIPQELYDAAELDGCNSWNKFKNVTMPMLLPVLRILLMMSMVNGMKIMDSVMVLTNGAPAGETDVVMLYIYRFFFNTGGAVKQWGYASCLGMITSVIICIMTVIYIKFSSKTSSID